MVNRTVHMTIDLQYLMRLSRSERCDVVCGVGGERLRPEAIEREIMLARNKGYTCLPTCDNPGPTGQCAGHGSQE